MQQQIKQLQWAVIIFTLLAFWAGFKLHGQSANGSSLPMTAVSGSMGGSLLLVGIPVSTTVNVPGARSSMIVDIAPTGFTMPAGVVAFGWVSANDTVTLQLTAIVAVTPASQTYRVTVTP